MQQERLNAALQVVSNMPVTGLKAERIRKVLQLTKELREAAEMYQDGRAKLFSEYEIQNDEQLNAHPQKKEIIEKVKEFDQMEIELKNGHFMKESELLEIAQKMPSATSGHLLFLMEILQENNQS